ncbi:MAG: DUF3108 domain-containing protein [Verrucomicrobia bacterium]|nr:DUF3108 domain-containing protein [Verrucomicrobiota bacterium]
MRGLIAAALLSAAALPGVSALPVLPGEELQYRVAWALLPGAGEIRLSAERREDPAGPRLRVLTHTRTLGLARMLLPFEARATADFTLADGRLRWLREETRQRGEQRAHHVAFDYAAGHALWTPEDATDATLALPIPPGDPADMILGLLRTRDWNLEPGGQRDALVLFNDEFYELTIHCVGRETVSSSLGTFSTRVLEPRMEKTAPKGMFRRGGTVRVWIAENRRRLPVRFSVEFKVGRGVATLTGHRPPPSDAPPAYP